MNINRNVIKWVNYNLFDTDSKIYSYICDVSTIFMIICYENSMIYADFIEMFKIRKFIF